MKTLVACQQQLLSLSCGAGKLIAIKEAFYGRRSEAVCPNGGQSNSVTCTDLNIVRKLDRRCGTLPVCDFEVNSLILGDPCSSVFKYVDVTFQCIGGY